MIKKIQTNKKCTYRHFRSSPHLNVDTKSYQSLSNTKNMEPECTIVMVYRIIIQATGNKKAYMHLKVELSVKFLSHKWCIVIRNFHYLSIIVVIINGKPYQSPGNRRQCAVFAFPFNNLSTDQNRGKFSTEARSCITKE